MLSTAILVTAVVLTLITAILVVYVLTKRFSKKPAINPLPPQMAPANGNTGFAGINWSATENCAAVPTWNPKTQGMITILANPAANVIAVPASVATTGETDPMVGASEKLAGETASYCSTRIKSLGIGRKLFYNQRLMGGDRFFVTKPENAMAHVIDSDHQDVAYMVPIRGAVPVRVNMTDLDEVEGKMFEIACYPSIRDALLAKDKDNRIYRMGKAIFHAMRNEEDSNALRLCQFAIEDYNKKLVIAPELNETAMLEGFAQVENEGYKVTHVVVHTEALRYLRAIPAYKDADETDFEQTGLSGTLWGAKVFASSRQAVDFALFASAPLVGEVAYRYHGFSGKAAPKPERLKQGAVISEEIGLVINNPRAISGLRIEAPREPLPPETPAIVEVAPHAVAVNVPAEKLSALSEEIARRVKETTGE